MKFKACRIASFTIIALILFFVGCIMDYSNSILSVQNKSQNAISVLYSNSSSPHTENNIAFYIADWEIISPDSMKNIYKNGQKNVWHDYIGEGKDKKLYLYFFSVDSLKKYDGQYSMDKLCAMQKYIQVSSYTEEQLKKINWKIVYKNH